MRVTDVFVIKLICPALYIKLQLRSPNAPFVRILLSLLEAALE